MHLYRRAVAVIAAAGLVTALAAGPALAGAPARVKVSACSNPADGSLVFTVSWALPGGGSYEGWVHDSGGGVLDYFADTAGPGGWRGSATNPTAWPAASVADIVVTGYSINDGSATATASAPWRTCPSSQLP